MNKQYLNQIGSLHEHTDCLCTLQKTSFDSEKNVYMTESQMSVINFDILKNQRSKALKLPNHPASVDALHITDDKSVYLIEFKNGRVYKENIIQKIYDSLVFLFDRKVMSDLSDCAKRLSFILVYNNNDKLKDELKKIHREVILALILQNYQEHRTFFPSFRNLKTIFSKIRMRMISMNFTITSF